LNPSNLKILQGLAGLGTTIEAKPNYNADIEEAICHALEIGLQGDLRVLGIVLNWFQAHGQRLIPSKLTKHSIFKEDKRASMLVGALSLHFRSDSRFKKFQMSLPKRRTLLFKDTEYLVKKNGEDERFSQGKLVVPKGFIRDRPGDIMNEDFLIKHHQGFRLRKLFGSNAKVDAVSAVLNAKEGTSLNELAKLHKINYKTIWEANDAIATTNLHKLDL